MFVACLVVWKCIDDPTGRTVADNYLEGARRWLNEDNVYYGPRGFLYLPEFAFLYSFLVPLPLWLSEAAGRLLQLGVLVSGLFAFSRFMGKPGEKSFFPLMSLVVFPVCFSSIRNGQTNIAILGFMLLAVVALSRKQWNAAGVFMTFGLLFKPTFIVFYLLAGALHRPMYWRLAAGILMAFLVPALFKGLDYVVQQHINFLVMMQEAFQFGVHKADWASLFGIFPQLTGYFVPEKIQMAVRLLLAPVVLFLAWLAGRRYNTGMSAYYIYALAACYLMLFNPRNENNDYAILSAAIGFWMAASVHRYQSRTLLYFCIFMLLGILAAWEISVRLTPGMDAWVTPLIATVFTLFIIVRLVAGRDECRLSSAL
ncbi:MAG: glycosyltransferase family 87 protein [Endozoicomonas sp.]